MGIGNEQQNRKTNNCVQCNCRVDHLRGHDCSHEFQMKKQRYPKTLSLKITEEMYAVIGILNQDLIRHLIRKALNMKQCPTCGHEMEKPTPNKRKKK